MPLSIACPNLQDRVTHPTYKQPSHEPVNQLIEFGMSVDDLHTPNHNENRFMYTLEDVQSEPELVQHRDWIRSTSPKVKEGNDHH